MAGLLAAFWLAVLGFFSGLFSKKPSALLPVPVTASTPNPSPKIPPASPFPPISLSGLFAAPASPPEPTHTHTPPASPVHDVDRSMSDGSFYMVSRDSFVLDPDPLPSPWSPVAKTPRKDVWMSVDGRLVDAAGPVSDEPCDADSLDIPVLVDLDESREAPKDPPKLKVLRERDQNRPAVTPRKRRDTLPSVTHSARSIKRLSTPLTKLEGSAHVRSATSISSMAYELGMGLFADGRGMSALGNWISVFEHPSPTLVHATPHQDAVVVG